MCPCVWMKRWCSQLQAKYVPIGFADTVEVIRAKHEKTKNINN